MPVTETALLDALKSVIDPNTGKQIKSISGLVHPGPAVFDGRHTMWLETYRSI